MKLSEYLKKKGRHAPKNYLWVETYPDGALYLNRTSLDNIKNNLLPYIDYEVYETKELDEECLTSHSKIIIPLEIKLSKKGELYVS